MTKQRKAYRIFLFGSEKKGEGWDPYWCDMMLFPEQLDRVKGLDYAKKAFTAYEFKCPVCKTRKATDDTVFFGEICINDECRFEEGVDDPEKYEGKEEY